MGCLKDSGVRVFILNREKVDVFIQLICFSKVFSSG